MKWTVLVGIVGVAIGFAAGHLSIKVKEGVEQEQVAERSGRRVRDGGSRNGERDVRKRGRVDGERLVKEAALSGESLSEISKARLMKWILELGAADFPEVLEELAKLSSPPNTDPFAGDQGDSDYITVALARWYELEGEMVLDWVAAKPGFLRSWKAGMLLQDLIQDGYERDPTLAFQLLKKHAAVIKEGVNETGISSSWFYQVGRWSRDVVGEFGELQGLVAQFGGEDGGADPFAGESDPFAADIGQFADQSFVKGMVVAGRGEEIRELFGGNEKMLKELDSIFQAGAIAELKAKGWQRVKNAIESGELNRTFWTADWVLEKWGSENQEEAVAWFLDQKFEDAERLAQIEQASYAIARTSGTGDLANDEVIKFLEQMDAQGEPTDEIWSMVGSGFIDERQWDGLENLKPRLPSGAWQDILTSLEESVVIPKGIRLGAGDILRFHELTSNGGELIRRFGIEEKVLESIAKTNEESLRQLHRILGVEE